MRYRVRSSSVRPSAELVVPYKTCQRLFAPGTLQLWPFVLTRVIYFCRLPSYLLYPVMDSLIWRPKVVSRTIPASSPHDSGTTVSYWIVQLTRPLWRTAFYLIKDCTPPPPLVASCPVSNAVRSHHDHHPHF